MKTLLLLRHGHAHPPGHQSDKARELSPRGVEEARSAGQAIRSLNVTPGLIVSSDARRATQTAAEVVEVLSIVGDLLVDPRLYATDVATLREIIRTAPDDAETLLLVGHNPEMSFLVTDLVADTRGAVPLTTGGLAHLQFNEAKEWSDIGPSSGRLAGTYLFPPVGR